MGQGSWGWDTRWEIRNHSPDLWSGQPHAQSFTGIDPRKLGSHVRLGLSSPFHRGVNQGSGKPRQVCRNVNSAALAHHEVENTFQISPKAVLGV